MKALEIKKEFAVVAIDYYGHTQCRGGSGKKVVYGFNFDDCDFWFSRKQDAKTAADWISKNDWDGIGDLEMILRSEGHDLGKCHF